MTNQVLFIGPSFKNPRGGISSVLAEYKKIYPKAYFVASTNSKNKLTKISTYIIGIFHFLFLLIIQRQIQIIHIHGASNSSFLRKFSFLIISKLFRKKVVYHIHGGGYILFYYKSKRFKQKIIQFFINHSDSIVCLSNSWKEFIEFNFSPRKTLIIPNIIEEPKQELIKLKQERSVKIFLFLGYIIKNKGIWLLLEVLKEHKYEINRNAVFHIAGNGETERLKKLIREYELNDVVKYIGWISGDNKHLQLSNSDIYILPSYNEGLPISILEAMSYALPVLSTSVGGIPEIVLKENGILFNPGNKDELWEAIKFFIDADNNTINKMGEASLQLVKPHLPNAVFQSLNELYNSLLCKN
jgi:glycosyltransferase involved in cell wall biosynthesis